MSHCIQHCRSYAYCIDRRLITSHEGNIVFGYWRTRMESFWMDGNIALQGYNSNDGNIQFLICRNDNDVKTAWRYDKTEKKL